jgi:hypothetical protein
MPRRNLKGLLLSVAFVGAAHLPISKVGQEEWHALAPRPLFFCASGEHGQKKAAVTRHIPTAAISAGLRPSEERDHYLSMAEAGFNSVMLMQVTEMILRAETVFALAQHRLEQMEFSDGLRARYQAFESQIEAALRSTREPTWVSAGVWSPCTYFLGFGPSGLAFDLLLFLHELQSKGGVVQQDASPVRLVDKHGDPFRDLVAEYVLHERLEGTDMTHRQIIGFTTELFGHGVFQSDHPGPPGRTAFGRPGETPLGRALRAFIHTHFNRQYGSRRLGRRVALSYFDVQSRAIRSAHGVITRALSRTSERLLIEADEGVLEIVPDRILSIEDIPPVAPDHRHILPKDDFWTAEALLDYVRQFGAVTIWEPHVRSLAAHGRDHLLSAVFATVIAARDREGQRIFAGDAQSREHLLKALTWSRHIGRALATLSLRLVIDGLTFNTRNITQSVVIFPGMPLPPQPPGIQFPGDAMHEFWNRVARFTHLTIMDARQHSDAEWLVTYPQSRRAA